jgi:hypothetical protein
VCSIALDIGDGCWLRAAVSAAGLLIQLRQDFAAIGQRLKCGRHDTGVKCDALRIGKGTVTQAVYLSPMRRHTQHEKSLFQAFREPF